jgi:hypothetical protein
LNELADLPVDGGEFDAGARQSRAMFHSQAIQLAHVFASEVLEESPAHQLLAKCNQDALLHFLAADRHSVGARATGSGAKAREAIAPIHHVPAAAFGALGQTGEEDFGRRA